MFSTSAGRRILLFVDRFLSLRSRKQAAEKVHYGFPVKGLLLRSVEL